MRRRDDLGISGDIVLVGADDRLRSKSSLAAHPTPGTSIANTGHLDEDGSSCAISSLCPRRRLMRTATFDAMGAPWKVVAVKSSFEALECVTDLKRGLMIGMGAVVLLTGLIGAVTAQRFVRPLIALTQALNNSPVEILSRAYRVSKDGMR